jgi:hypothetical protein
MADERTAGQGAQLAAVPLDGGSALDDHEALAAGALLVAEPAAGRKQRFIARQL